jgi:hypothetical protein
MTLTDEQKEIYLSMMKKYNFSITIFRGTAITYMNKPLSPEAMKNSFVTVTLTPETEPAIRAHTNTAAGELQARYYLIQNRILPATFENLRDIDHIYLGDDQITEQEIKDILDTLQNNTLEGEEDNDSQILEVKEEQDYKVVGAWFSYGKRDGFKTSQVRTVVEEQVMNYPEPEQNPCATCHIGGDPCRDCEEGQDYRERHPE